MSEFPVGAIVCLENAYEDQQEGSIGTVVKCPVEDLKNVEGLVWVAFPLGDEPATLSVTTLGLTPDYYSNITPPRLDRVNCISTMVASNLDKGTYRVSETFVKAGYLLHIPEIQAVIEKLDDPTAFRKMLSYITKDSLQYEVPLYQVCGWAGYEFGWDGAIPLMDSLSAEGLFDISYQVEGQYEVWYPLEDYSEGDVPYHPETGMEVPVDTVVKSYRASDKLLTLVP